MAVIIYKVGLGFRTMFSNLGLVYMYVESAVHRTLPPLTTTDGVQITRMYIRRNTFCAVLYIYCYYWVDAISGELLVPRGIIPPVVRLS